LQHKVELLTMGCKPTTTSANWRQKHAKPCCYKMSNNDSTASICVKKTAPHQLHTVDNQVRCYCFRHWL